MVSHRAKELTELKEVVSFAVALLSLLALCEK
jgi:hypothetical protein